MWVRMPRASTPPYLISHSICVVLYCVSVTISRSNYEIVSIINKQVCEKILYNDLPGHSIGGLEVLSFSLDHSSYLWNNKDRLCNGNNSLHYYLFYEHP